MRPMKSMEENIRIEPYFEYIKLVFWEPYSWIYDLDRVETSIVVFLCNFPMVSSF